MAEKAGAEIFTVKTGSLVKHIDLKEGATAFAFSRDSRTLALGSGRLLSGGPGVENAGREGRYAGYFALLANY